MPYSDASTMRTSLPCFVRVPPLILRPTTRCTCAEWQSSPCGRGLRLLATLPCGHCFVTIWLGHVCSFPGVTIPSVRELTPPQIPRFFYPFGCPIFADRLPGIPQIKPTFLEIAPSGIPSNIIPHSKGVKCGLIRSNSPFSYSNHRPAKPKTPKPLVYAQVSPLGTSFATP